MKRRNIFIPCSWGQFHHGSKARPMKGRRRSGMDQMHFSEWSFWPEDVEWIYRKQIPPSLPQANKTHLYSLYLKCLPWGYTFKQLLPSLWHYWEGCGTRKKSSLLPNLPGYEQITLLVPTATDRVSQLPCLPHQDGLIGPQTVSQLKSLWLGTWSHQCDRSEYTFL